MGKRETELTSALQFVKVGYLLPDEDAFFEEQTVYRKLKILRTQVIRKNPAWRYLPRPA